MSSFALSVDSQVASSSYKFRLVVFFPPLPTNLLVIRDVSGNGAAADPGEPTVSTDVLPLASGDCFAF
jgi:hypothetical protein